ncbi:putative Zn-dependent peptidase [Kineosphaera limosa]|uniref:Putative peptidase M16 family protein n=1 Tax=Kineosphaera limosa NBRC 100340 TaxID=1184609 RepID=K6WTH3_9MICO|nr:pitrilysin family protein [Kineosphaera limosa]NYE02543.1 putative Zn-dependent peptidase [Kineosphaera limosa]GAB97156.1 putative peptidase M16 family protein [Kineosphaera limosa NBRC 100340]
MPLAYEIAEHTLGNGLRVVVNEDHSVPVVAVNLWVGVGSRHEPPGRTGFAHLFEHLMFQGSKNVASGEHFSVLMGHGARLNATTWFDRTNYFETLPAGALDLALWMEADRHGNLLAAVTQENLDNQRDVVKEEKRQRYDNVPYGQALSQLYAAVFPQGHPYSHPTIGSMADLDAATLQDVHDFFSTWYRPSNTVLTLAGDLTPREGFAGAQKYFGQIADAPVPQPPLTPAVPPRSTPVRVDVVDDVPAARLYLGFRLPVDDTAEFFAASAAIDALAGLTISRLERRLVRELELCTHLSGASMGLVDNVSLGFFVAEAAAGVESARIEEELCAQLEAFADQGPTVAEMEAVVAQNERAWLSSLAALEERADHISRTTLLFDDPRAINTLLDRTAAVSADQVGEAASAWLRPHARATVSYTPGEPARHSEGAAVAAIAATGTAAGASTDSTNDSATGALGGLMAGGAR